MELRSLLQKNNLNYLHTPSSFCSSPSAYGLTRDCLGGKGGGCGIRLLAGCVSVPSLPVHMYRHV